MASEGAVQGLRLTSSDGLTLYASESVIRQNNALKKGSNIVASQK